MDQNNNSTGNNEQKSKGFDSYYAARNSRINNFKVSIDGFDTEPPQYTPIKVPGESPYFNQPPKKQASERTATTPRSTAAPTAQRTTSQGAKGKAAGKPQAKAPSQSRTSAQSKAARPASQGTAQGKRRTAQRLTPAQLEKQKLRKRYNRIKGVMVLCVCLIVITVITATASSLALATINDILALKKGSSETVAVEIPENADFEKVYSILCDNKLVNQELITKFFCKFRHYDQYKVKDKVTQEVKVVPVEYEPGIYYLESGSGVEVMLQAVKKSRSVSKDTVRLTFPEGWSIAQIFERIEKYKVCSAEKLYANLDIVGRQFKFYEKIPQNSGRYLRAEGYAFPDTYDFFIGEGANSVLKKLFSNFNQKWTKEYTQKANELGLSRDQIIIIASIIQREANDKSQMGDISSVIHNRLNDSSTYPQLQMDSTQDYISSLKKYDVFNDFYYSIYYDAYNTYRATGLPPGAICNPGIDAINAALNPNDTDYRFFVHDKQGHIYLATTAAEHKKNTEIALYD